MSKTDLHPKDYRFVVFSDEAAGFSFLTRSTAQSEETIKWTDGNEYPLVKVQISSASHPFFTGEEKIIDTEGRVDRFKALLAIRRRKLKKRRFAKRKKLKRQTLNLLLGQVKISSSSRRFLWVLFYYLKIISAIRDKIANTQAAIAFLVL